MEQLLMEHLMVDIETVGTNQDAPIISIGALFFDPVLNQCGESFYQVVDLVSSAQIANIDADTVKWWMRQGDDARAVFNDTNAVSLPDALQAFANFIASRTEIKNVKIWGNGCNFDNAIIRASYEKLGMQAPWRFYNDRDVRTLVELIKTMKGIDVRNEVIREGVFHNALDDAIHQAKYVMKAFQLMQ